MAPSFTETVPEVILPTKEKVSIPSTIPSKDTNEVKGPLASTQPERKPLKLSGALDHFESFDVTPIIGKEFVGVNVAEWLRAPNSDELIRELAITISERGVVFFRKQDDITDDLQKELVQRLGELSGKPADSGLHIHPVSNSGQETGANDDEISVISSDNFLKLYQHKMKEYIKKKKQTSKDEWHSDISFEPAPSDYCLLRLTELPKTGGDTLWASGYEVYDRLSEPYQKFLETLTATFAEDDFNPGADSGISIYTEPRGSPHNVGDVLQAVHPVVRTNPVTGWKSVFALGMHFKHINEVTELESKVLKDWFVRLVVDNYDLQVRHRWQNPNDMAIWDNRSMYHAANPDFYGQGLGNRTGHRAVSIGERPYFDPNSTSRKASLLKRRMEAMQQKAL